MISYILNAIMNTNVPEVLIYISIALEAILSVIGILCYFFPETTKFGKFLRVIFKGAKKVQDKVEVIAENTDEQNNKEADKNE